MKKGTRSATTDGQGRYVLYIPWNFGPFTLSHPLRPATGWNDGSTAHPVSGWSEAQSPAFPTLDAGAIAGTEVARNFGVVRESRLYPPQTGQAASPGVVVYAHLYRPGTLGGLTLSLANAPSWTVQVRVDGNCDGDFDDPGEGFASLPQTLPVGPSWPREADGSLKACALEVRVLVPPGVPAGAVDVTLLQGALSWANNPGVVDLRSLADTTTVSGGEVRLEKRVRNVSQGTGFGTLGEGRPGEVLEYCVAYRNLGTASVSQFVLTDPVPFFTDPLPSVPDYGGKAIRWSPGPAPEGSEAWREVELEALLAEGGRLLEREAASAAEAQALAEEAKELALRLQAHPLGESDRALALLTVLEAFRKAMERLAARYEAWASDRVAREGTAYAAHLSFPQRLARLRYRDRTGE